MRLSRERIGRFLLALAIVAGVAAIGLRVGLGPLKQGNVYLVFSWAGRQWESAGPLYATRQQVFRYGPPCAAAFEPWGWLPDRLGGLLWRLASGAVLACAVVHFVRRLAPDVARSVPFIGFCFVVLPWALANLNNGQSNPFLLGLLLLALDFAATESWTLAAAALAGAAWLKLYPLSLALLLVLWRPRQLAPWLLLFLALGFGLPFLTQDASYVWGQYAAWLEYSSRDLRMDIPVEAGNRDLWQVVRLLGLPLAIAGYQALQAASALGLAILAWLMRPKKGTDPRERLLTLGGLATAWMLLFGPATESSTYLLIVPFLGVELSRWRSRSPSRRAAGLVCVAALHVVILGTWASSLKFLHFCGLQQFATLGCAALWLGDAIRLIRHSAPAPLETGSDRIAFVASMPSQRTTAAT